MSKFRIGSDGLHKLKELYLSISFFCYVMLPLLYMYLINSVTSYFANAVRPRHRMLQSRSKTFLNLFI